MRKSKMCLRQLKRKRGGASLLLVFSFFFACLASADSFDLIFQRVAHFYKQRFSVDLPCRPKIVFSNFRVGFTEWNENQCYQTIMLSTDHSQFIETAVNLSHEMVHFYRHRHPSQQVLWYEEGLAENFENSFINSQPLEAFRQIAGKNRIELSTNARDFQNGSLHYVTSYFFIKYIAGLLEGNLTLTEMLKSMETGWPAVMDSIQSSRSRMKSRIDLQFSNPRALWKNFSIAYLLDDPRQQSPMLRLNELSFPHLTKYQIPSSPQILRRGECSGFSTEFTRQKNITNFEGVSNPTEESLYLITIEQNSVKSVTAITADQEMIDEKQDGILVHVCHKE